MKKLVVLLAPSAVVAAVIVACTGSDAAPAAGTVAPGQLGGECFTNLSCNAGLVCTVIDGKAKCANAATDGSVLVPADGAVTDPDAGRVRCTNFKTTEYACDDKTSCYPADAGADAGPSRCIDPAGACEVDELRWACHSAHYCPTGACCVMATLTPPNTQCGEGKLQLTGAGSACAATCPEGSTRLCQANVDCPADEHCSPVRVFGPPSSIQGTILAVCLK